MHYITQAYLLTNSSLHLETQNRRKTPETIQLLKIQMIDPWHELEPYLLTNTPVNGISMENHIADFKTNISHVFFCQCTFL
ncbi:hypothetical protein C1H46_045758 [Malus baccata]|uniref:Uncharacterized protein n=1 Tax=Malus baccata TaxID=106549 RepID=A0A540K364_MALBA|nr:hypothetical protein C1H46_045758 [Malus baccata]